jgi:hypothetical protein
MMIDTPAHLQHMSVVKHFVSILSGCGKHSIPSNTFNRSDKVGVVRPLKQMANAPVVDE